MPAARTLADWLIYQQELHPNSIDLGLERVRAVAERLGLLPLAGRTAIIGGTNGKGSTATLLAALGRAHGERVGLFTSPHLLRYQERISVDGVEAGDAQLVAAFERIEAARGGISLTYFEFNTLAALELFRAAQVGLSILEVGLGGRLDATNVVDADVAVLCSVGFDHRDWLGETLEAIGAEKAGIFRHGGPAILGTTQMPASVYSALAALQCKVATAERDFHWQVSADGSWDYRQGEVELLRLPAPALAGEIQYRNAATALAAMGLLRAPAALEPAAVAAALCRVRLPGRLQRVAGSVEWVLDVAHNEPAAAVLAHELRAFGCRGRTLAVFGMLADKDVAAVAAQLDPQVDHWLLCTPQGPRALEAARLAERMASPHGEVEICGAVESACLRATQLAVPGDRILVCGSFHTVGPALQWRGLY
jgi:dihydrofolate synthase/folylpolyglutamate synthase